MTSPPAGPPDGGQHQRPSPKSGRREAGTTGRRELGRHARFAELSPEVGVLDEQAARQMMGEDPAAFELLAAMTVATD
jgi:magnesium chelatase subunit D